MQRHVVCVQGLGFVGSAMALAVAEARSGSGEPLFDVIGIDLPTDRGEHAVRELNAGRFPAETGDPSLSAAAARAHSAGNLRATTDPAGYAHADVVIVDIDFDLSQPGVDGEPSLDLSCLRHAIATIGQRIRPGSLVLVETTVPPGTCANVVGPELEACFAARGIPPSEILLAHSYERVMPGDGYLRSITHFWRVFAANSDRAAEACEAFLAQVIDTRAYPLTRLATTTASETAKVLENSYRAVTIAFMEEWGRFAELVGVDVHEVVEAIRLRPTHSNMRQPGFGVGGYCLTKDPLFARAAAKHLFNLPDLDFPFSRLAVSVNDRMPLVSVEMLAGMFGGGLDGRRVLLLGVAYRPAVGDTRRSPSESFVRELHRRGASVTCHDPYVKHWPELGVEVAAELPSPGDHDAVVIAVAHPQYTSLDVVRWLGGRTPAVLDTNAVLSRSQRAALEAAGCAVRSIGRGVQDHPAFAASPIGR